MHVVIVGGGLAGICAMSGITRQLNSRRRPACDVTMTVIDPKNYLEIEWATYRALFDDGVASNCELSYVDIFSASPFATHVQGSVASVEYPPSGKSVTLADGTIMPYDVLILATGAATTESILCAQQTDMADRTRQLRAYGQGLLLHASSVLVVGGGPIGCEVAGDIKYYATQEGKNIDVTLVQKRDALVPEYGDRAGAMVRQQLEGLGVRVHTGCVAVSVPVEDGSVKKYKLKPVTATEASGGEQSATERKEEEDKEKENERQKEREKQMNSEDGTEEQKASTEQQQPEDSEETEDVPTITIDAVFTATGVSPMSPHLLPKATEESSGNNTASDGWVDVDRYGRVKACDGSVFAYGDCTRSHPKTGVKAMNNKKSIAANVLVTVTALAEDKVNDVDEGKLTAITEPPSMAVVTTGRKSGVAHTPIGATTWVLPRFKNRTMFLGHVRSEVGL